MLNLKFFEQKSLTERFLFILGIFMVLVFVTLAIIVIFFSDSLGLDPEKLRKEYRIAFAILLVVYAGIRFGRIVKKNDQD